jgi:hypothetical protein
VLDCPEAKKPWAGLEIGRPAGRESLQRHPSDYMAGL